LNGLKNVFNFIDLAVAAKSAGMLWIWNCSCSAYKEHEKTNAKIFSKTKFHLCVILTEMEKYYVKEI